MGNNNKKKKNYVEANVMNIYAKFSIIPLMASEKKIFFFFFKISLSVGIATNQNQRFWQNSYGW